MSICRRRTGRSRRAQMSRIRSSMSPLIEGLLSTTSSAAQRRIVLSNWSSVPRTWTPMIHRRTFVGSSSMNATGVHVPERIRAHFSHERLPERAGAIDQHSTAAFAARGRDEIHGPKGCASGHDGNAQQQCVQDEHRPRKPFKAVEVRGSHDREQRSHPHAAQRYGHVA